MIDEAEATWDQLEMLVCPACRGPVTRRPEGLLCSSCNITYRITDGLPRMVNESWLDPSVAQEQAAQDNHFAALSDKAVFKPEYHCRYRQVRIQQRLDHLLSALDEPVNSGCSVHVACCGTGYEVEALVQAGCQTSCSDLSVQALRGLAKRSATRGYQVPHLQADVLQLPFRNDSFDVAVTVEGLHHTPQPLRSFGELVRVARSHVVVIEPYTGGLLDLLGRLGLAHREEYSHRRACRFNAGLLKQIGSLRRVKLATIRFYLDLPPGPMADTLGDWPLSSSLLVGFSRVADQLLGPVGIANKVLLVAAIE